LHRIGIREIHQASPQNTLRYFTVRYLPSLAIFLFSLLLSSSGSCTSYLPIAACGNDRVPRARGKVARKTAKENQRMRSIRFSDERSLGGPAAGIKFEFLETLLGSATRYPLSP